MRIAIPGTLINGSCQEAYISESGTNYWLPCYVRRQDIESTTMINAMQLYESQGFLYKAIQNTQLGVSYAGNISINSRPGEGISLNPSPQPPRSPVQSLPSPATAALRPIDSLSLSGVTVNSIAFAIVVYLVRDCTDTDALI